MYHDRIANINSKDSSSKEIVLNNFLINLDDGKNCQKTLI